MKRRRIALAVAPLAAALVATGALAGPRTDAPPGGAIVFERLDPSQSDESECYGRLWEIAPDGSNLHELAPTGAGQCDPDVSPDGAKLVFSSENAVGAVTIWVSAADGTQAQRLTTGGTDYMPAWSPDGSEIAFEREQLDAYRLYVMRADGSGLRSFPTGGDFEGTPDWSPKDGDLLVAGAGSDALGRSDLGCRSKTALYRVSPDARTIRRLTRCRFDSLMPQWSPDGTQIAWVRARARSQSNDYVLVVMGEDTTHVSVLGHNAHSPVWSPDGRWLAYGHEGVLTLVPRAGGAQVELVGSPTEPADEPTWRP